MTEIFIRELWIYPVKSLGGVRVDATAITSAGSLALDREWIVIDPDQRKVWQGDIPKMTLVRVAIANAMLTLSLDGMPDLSLPLDHAGTPTQLSMYKNDFAGIDAGDAAAAWLTTALGAPLRLVRIGDAAHRWPGLNPVHVVSEASLVTLNDAMLAQGEAAAVPMRFRPNVLLGSSEPIAPWFEEQSPVLDFGEARLTFRDPCVRCELPNISLVDASRGRQPLKLIGQLSKTRTTGAPASFGTYCRADGGTLRAGMRASVA